jgi:hypothetical protein
MQTYCTSTKRLQKFVTHSRFSCRDSVLINGMGSTYCPGVDYLLPLVPEGLAESLLPEQINDKG